MRLRYIIWVFATAIAYSFALAQPLSRTARPSQLDVDELSRYGGTLTIGIAPVQTLDSQAATDVSSRQVISCIGEGLYSFDRQGYLTPALARDLPEQEGENNWIIRLREGLKFHDGNDLDAQAVVYTYYRLKSLRGDDNVVRTVFGNIKSVQAVDKTTIRVTLHRPDPTIGYLFARQELYPLSPRSVERYGKNYGRVAAAGAGPFRLSEWGFGKKLTLQRYEGYWDSARPYLQVLVFKFRDTEEARRRDFFRHRVSVLVDLSPKEASIIRAKRKYAVGSMPGTRLVQLYLNTEHPPFSNPRVRQALAYAIDRRSLVTKLYSGWATEARSLFPPLHWAHRPEFRGISYDAAKSRELLRQVQPPLQFPVEFTLLYTQEPRFASLAWFLKKQLKGMGFEVHLRPLPKPELLDYLYGRQGRDRAAFGAVLEDWAGNPHPDSYSYLLYYSGSTYNKACYADYMVDKLLGETKSVSTEKKMRPFYYLAEELITMDANTIYLCLPHFIFARSGSVRELTASPFGQLDFSRVWFKKRRRKR